MITGLVGAVLAGTTGQAGAASQPGIAIATSASVSSYSAGTTITYTYVVLNTGSDAFDNVTVTDPLKGLSDISCDGGSNVIPTLNAFQSTTCAATYTTTQADVDAGSLSNTGMVSVQSPVGNFSAQSSVTLPAVRVPQLSLTKSASIESYSAAGTPVTYTFVITNTGSVTLSNVAVSDPMPGLSSILCPGGGSVVASLAPGASATCTATYTTTAADVSAGSITNVATATGTAPNGSSVQSNGGTTVPVAGSSFTCTTPTNFLSQTNSNNSGAPTQLYYSVASNNTYSWIPLGPLYHKTYNALGFDPADNYLYAIVTDNKKLLKIDASGAATSTTIPGFPVIAAFPNTGGFDASGNYWVTSGGRNMAYEIDVSTSSIDSGSPVTLSQTFEPNDWTYTQGYFWGLDGTTMYRVQLPSGTVHTFSVPGVNSGTYGAAWTFGNGNLGFSNNQTGTVYEISVTGASSSNPSATRVATYHGPVADLINDGSSCIAQPSDLSIVKTGPATVVAGGTITWTLTVTNNGPGNSSGFVVDDTVPAGVTNVSTSTPGCTVNGNDVQCAEGLLDAGNTFSVTLTGIAPTSVGTCFVNSASAIGDESDSNPDNNTSSVQTCTQPAISIVKSASVPTYSSAGTVITYTYVVTNTSTNEALTNVTVTDPMSGLSAIDCGGGSPTIPALSAGASQTCTATYTTTQVDVDAGSITNTGTATGTPPSGPDVSASSTVTIEEVPDPAISIVKSATVQSYTSAGTVITYGFQVTNTGNETLTSVTVTDPMPGLSSISCNGGTNVISTLAPGASATCTATYTTTQTDVTAGSLSNTATASGMTPEGQGVSAESSVTIPVVGQPFTCDSPSFFLSQGSPTQLFSGTESSASATFSSLGPIYTQTYNALGFDPLDDFLYAMVLSGPGANELLQIDASGNVTSLGPVSGYTAVSDQPVVGTFDASGNYWIVTRGTSTSTAYEIDVTSSPPAVINTVSLSGQFSPPDWSPDDGYMWGMTNGTMYRVDLGTGTVDTFGAPSGVGPGTFGADWTFGNGNLGFSNNQTGTIYQISVSNPSGPVSNPPQFNLVSTYVGPVPPQNNNDGASCIGKATDLAIAKTGPATVSAGGTITWDLTVTNEGPGNSSGFAVDDNVPPGVTNVTAPNPTPNSTQGCTVTGNDVQCAEGALPDGASFTIVLTGIAPTTDSTCVVNTASVVANESDPNQANNSSTVQTCTNSGVDLVKEADVSTFSSAGVPITYTYEVQDTGVEPLTDVTVADPMKALSTINCGDGSDDIGTLEGGASQTCAAMYTTTQADVDAGSVQNVGTVTATSSTGEVSAQSSLSIPAQQDPALDLVKSASVSGFKKAGTPITYGYQVTNSGNVTLTDVSVDDPMPGLSPISCGNGTDEIPSLPPTATTTCTATYVTTPSDVQAGQVTNTGVASGTDTVGNGVTSNSSSVTVPFLGVVITSPPDLTAVLGEPFSATLTASGGQPPYKWSITEGALPKGLKLSVSGGISGVPVVAGTKKVTIEVVAAKGKPKTATQVLTITVQPHSP